MKKTLKSFRGWVLENFPFIEADFDALTTYQLISKIIEYINFIAADLVEVENNYNTLIEIVNELQEYVEELEVDTTQIKADIKAIRNSLENYYNKTEVNTLISSKEDKSNKVTSINDTSTDTQYPSAKCVYDAISNVDLTDYVKNTDYASDNTGGVVKVASTNGWGVNNNGVLYPFNIAYQNYLNAGNTYVISKGTLENVITGKNLVINTDYATTDKGGVIKDGTTSLGYNITQSGTNAGRLETQIKNYNQYKSMYTNGFIGKGTLENIFPEKIKEFSGYDNTKTQVLKNINGTLTWVDEI